MKDRKINRFIHTERFRKSKFTRNTIDEFYSDRLGKRYKKAYEFACKEIQDDSDFLVKEWWLRTHLVIDHISGMTDEFALNTYQMLEGIQLLKV